MFREVFIEYIVDETNLGTDSIISNIWNQWQNKVQYVVQTITRTIIIELLHVSGQKRELLKAEKILEKYRKFN